MYLAARLLCILLSDCGIPSLLKF
uniref:Ankyrin repeat domain-containing protein 13C-A-like n=1 Tax=Rhizophora mucronata TaxID=61149 RepID=A0A2P2R3A0_RHIMU